MTTSTEERSVAIATRGSRLSKALLANVVLLTMIAPLATDMYVPAFPIVGDDLQSSATEVQALRRPPSSSGWHSVSSSVGRSPTSGDAAGPCSGRSW